MESRLTVNQKCLFSFVPEILKRWTNLMFVCHRYLDGKLSVSRGRNNNESRLITELTVDKYDSSINLII